MGFGLIFGIGAFFLVGALVGDAAKDAGSGLGPAFIAAILAFFGGCYLQAKHNAAKDNPAATVTGAALPLAYGTVKNILTTYHRGTDWWSIRQDDPQSGKLVAVMKYEQKMSVLDLPGNKYLAPEQRQIVLTVVFTPVGANTAVNLNWEVIANIHRIDCDEIISDVTQRIQAGLSAYGSQSS